MTADHVSSTSLLNWVSGTLQIPAGLSDLFSVTAWAILPWAQLIFFICLSNWFIPWHTELCAVNTPRCCPDCSHWAASLAVHFTTFTTVCATRLIVVPSHSACVNSSLKFVSPQWGGKKISEVASCDTLLRQHRTVSHFQQQWSNYVLWSVSLKGATALPTCFLTYPSYPLLLCVYRLYAYCKCRYVSYCVEHPVSLMESVSVICLSVYFYKVVILFG